MAVGAIFAPHNCAQDSKIIFAPFRSTVMLVNFSRSCILYYVDDFSHMRSSGESVHISEFKSIQKAIEDVTLHMLHDPFK